MMKTVWNNLAKYEAIFYARDWYVSGDSAYMDEEGYFWFQGRVDDVIITAGERVGPFEVESKLVEHPAVAEAGLSVSQIQSGAKLLKPLLPFVTDTKPTEELNEEIRQFVKEWSICTCRTT